MQRREFIMLLGGASVAWPLAARAQQPDRIRRIGVLLGLAEDDPEAKALLSEFTQGLSERGWVEGRNLRMDVRWAGSSTDLMHTFAKELVDLQPDVILANTTPVTAALKRETQTIRIVFTIVSDPVGSGFVENLAHPVGNLTGFMYQDASMVGKLLELLTEIAPKVKRAALMFNPDTAPYMESYYVPAFEAAALTLKVAPILAPVHNDVEIEAVIGSLARAPGAASSEHPINLY